MSNLHYTFYKEYYQYLLSPKSENENENFTEHNNRKIVDASFSDGNRLLQKSVFSNKFIYLRTNYPGLLTGVGMPHYVGRSKKEINLGFCFDYVTGFPYIPGSTVKGCLRQAFTGKKMVYVSEFLNISEEHIVELKEQIFGHDQEDSESEKSGSDIFFDAQIIAGSEKAGGKILGIDNITPHKSLVDEPDIINILKILPDVTFEFQFNLKDSILSDGTIISADRKKELFEAILIDFGIGAKTNVGYGVLSRAEPEVKRESQVPSREAQIDCNRIYLGYVMEVASGQIKVKLDGQETYPRLKKSQMTQNGEPMNISKMTKVFQINDRVAVTFSNGDKASAILEYNNQSDDVQKKMCPK